MEVFIFQLIVCPPRRLLPVPVLAHEPPAVGEVSGLEELGSTAPLSPSLGGGRGGIETQEKEQGDGWTSGWAPMGPDVQMVYTNSEFLDSPLVSQTHTESSSTVRMVQNKAREKDFIRGE